jgi:cyclase
MDIAAGRVVKGVNFKNLQDMGDPIEKSRLYAQQGADEIVFLDVTASNEGRETTYDLVRKSANEIFVPLTVGGGVRSIKDVDQLLRSGADKVSINTAAIARPELIDEIVEQFGSQVLVISIDARRSDSTPSGFEVTTHGGHQVANKDALDWAAEAASRGVGEVLLNSMDADGTRAGFDIPMITAVRAVVNLPLIASGGAGEPEHFVAAAKAGADALLAAGIFHDGSVSVSEVKAALSKN